MGVSAPGLEGPWGGRRARAEVTEERVPFLEIVSEPLGQGRVRGATASSLISFAGSSRALTRWWYKRTDPASSPSPTRVPTTAPATTVAPGPVLTSRVTLHWALPTSLWALQIYTPDMEVERFLRLKDPWIASRTGAKNTWEDGGDRTHWYWAVGLLLGDWQLRVTLVPTRGTPWRWQDGGAGGTEGKETG